MPSPIESALQILVKAKADVQEVLAPVQMETNSIFITSGVDKIINSLAFQLGLQPGTETAAPQTFEPVTEFFGEKIERAEGVLPDSLIAPKDDRDIYVAKLDALQSAFATMPAETIISSYSQPSDELVLRGVAKRAGLEDYEKGTINIYFVERIKSGFDSAAKAAVEEAKINAELEGQPVEFNMPLIGETDVQDVPAEAGKEDLSLPEHAADVTDAAPKPAAKKATKK